MNPENETPQNPLSPDGQAPVSSVMPTVQPQQPASPSLVPADTPPVSSPPQVPGVPSAVSTSKDPLDYMHKHNSVISKIILACIVLASLFNVYMIFHVLRVREDNYQKLPQVQREVAQNSFSDPVVDRPDGTLEMSGRVDENAVHAQDLKAKLNQQVNFSNGYSFIFTGYEMDWQPPEGARGTTPAEGMTYLKLDVTAGNRSNHAEPSNSIFFFLTGKVRVVDSDGDISQAYARVFYCYTCSTAGPFGGRTDVADSLSLADLNPGETISGSYAVQVPIGKVPKLVIEKKDYSALSEVVLKAEITLE